MREEVTRSPQQSRSRQTGIELYFGLVRAIGSDVDAIVQGFRNALEIYNVQVEPITLSELIFRKTTPQLPAGYQSLSDLEEKDLFGYYELLMDAGDRLRKTNPQLPARLAVKKVKELRKSQSQDGYRGRVYIFRTLMHEEEVTLLHQIYGDRFFLIGIFESESRRRRNLEAKLMSSAKLRQTSEGKLATALMDRDRGAKASPRGKAQAHRLSIEDTFFRSDVFLAIEDDAPIHLDEDRESTNEVIRRFLRQLFSNPVGVPTPEETGISYAYLAARTTSALGRRVGAAVVSEDGDLVAVGANEVPKAGGGLYGVSGQTFRDYEYEFETPTDRPTYYRQKIIGADSADILKVNLIFDFLYRVACIENPESDPNEVRAKVDELLQDPFFEESEVMQLITFSRTVHAELAAISTAARVGRSVRGGTLYCTTFPCHECARHVIATGIDEVVYVEPYPKSRVAELHKDAVRFPGDSDREGVLFRPFIGISPGRQETLYWLTERKWRPDHQSGDDAIEDSPPLAYGQSRHHLWRKETAPVRRSVIPDPPLSDVQFDQIRMLEDAFTADEQ